MKFTKMHGAGNDFIIVDNRDLKLSDEELSKLTAQVCRRRLSIGADGLMAVDSPERGGDFKMTYFNADGSLGEMCGNGARCISRYGYENGLAGDVMNIEVTAGKVVGERLDERNYRVRLNDVTCMETEMALEFGEDELERINLTGDIAEKLGLASDKEGDGLVIPVDYVELGSPGIPAIALPFKGIGEQDRASILELGRALCHHRKLPKGANVNFYDLIGTDELNELTFERGVEDFTYACGTGTGSMVSALTVKEMLSGANIRVHVPGGVLIIDAIKEDGRIKELYLTGPTNIVSVGEIVDEDLNL